MTSTADEVRRPTVGFRPTRTINRLFLAESTSGERAGEDLAALAEAARGGLAARTLEAASGLVGWHWMDDDALDGIRHRVALAAVDLLVATDRRPVRACPGPNCGWLFLDTSRGGRRHWCSEETCGVRSRVLRYRGRST